MDREKLDKLESASLQRRIMLPQLKAACESCRMCNLGWNKAKKDNWPLEYDPQVFSNYKPESGWQRFMIVGQNPGWDEVRKKEPFVGKSGENFDEALKQTPWSREDFYITNTVKCFTKKNRQPTAEEISRCEPFFKMELEIIKPILVVAFGATAFGLLVPKVKFGDSIGQIVESNKYGIKVFTTYHPSPRNLIDGERKKQFYKDVKNLGSIMTHYLTPF